MKMIGLGGGALRLAGVIGAVSWAVCTTNATAAVIPGDPLQIFMDGSARMQARFQGAAAGELKPASADFTHRAGMNFTIYHPSAGSAYPCGPLFGSALIPVSGPTAVTGAGTVASPYEMSTSYLCNTSPSFPTLEITQTFVYVNGDDDFIARYAVTNPGTEAVPFRAISRGVFAAAGSDRGQGIFDASPPRLVGMFNDAQGSEGGFLELASSPWSRYLEGTDQLFNTPFDGGEQDAFGDGLDNVVDPALVIDPRVAVQFDRYRSSGLAPGATDTFEVNWFFGRYDGLSLTPLAGAQTVGQSWSVTATSLNHGEPVTAAVIRYSITGANPSSRSASTAADGTATLTWTGSQPGEDTLTAYLDSDNNGVFDPGIDTQKSATVSWTAGPPAAPPPPPPPPTVPSSIAQPGCPLTGNVVVAGSGNDTRTGTSASDIIFGRAGNDVLRGGRGDDCLYGQAGADRLYGASGADRLFGGDGSDRLRGGTGNDDLRGGQGADELSDDRGRDSFSGGAGSDRIDARDLTPGDRRRPDRVRCGPGRGDRARVDRRDHVAADCERVRRR